MVPLPPPGFRTLLSGVLGKPFFAWLDTLTSGFPSGFSQGVAKPSRTFRGECIDTLASGIMMLA